jgi:hypothetical protein
MKKLILFLLLGVVVGVMSTIIAFEVSMPKSFSIKTTPRQEKWILLRSMPDVIQQISTNKTTFNDYVLTYGNKDLTTEPSMLSWGDTMAINIYREYISGDTTYIRKRYLLCGKSDTTEIIVSTK